LRRLALFWEGQGLFLYILYHRFVLLRENGCDISHQDLT